jgi:hypothetical protein
VIPFRRELRGGGGQGSGDINRFLTLTFQRGINNKIIMLVLMDKRTIPDSVYPYFFSKRPQL